MSLEAPETEEELLELEAEPEERERPIAATAPTSRGERRAAHANALGLFIERQFAKKESPCHSYSDLERHSNISREALSRYVTSRADRRRAPTIDTMVAIADALRVSLEGVARAAAASVTGVVPPPEDVQKAREEALGALVAPLSDAQFNAVAELLRQMRPEREK
jgi:transcriptional regulator with XRE-family HTH domain